MEPKEKKTVSKDSRPDDSKPEGKKKMSKNLKIVIIFVAAVVLIAAIVFGAIKISSAAKENAKKAAVAEVLAVYFEEAGLEEFEVLSPISSTYIKVYCPDFWRLRAEKQYDFFKSIELKNIDYEGERIEIRDTNLYIFIDNGDWYSYVSPLFAEVTGRYDCGGVYKFSSGGGHRSCEYPEY